MYKTWQDGGLEFTEYKVGGGWVSKKQMAVSRQDRSCSVGVVDPFCPSIYRGVGVRSHSAHRDKMMLDSIGEGQVVRPLNAGTACIQVAARPASI